MNIYTPTYLYIKQHSVTEKLYFGKTKHSPDAYIGSGLYWLRHIKDHGKEHVVTLWYCLFLDKESIKEFALNFSKQENIVESECWANLIEENGLNGNGLPKNYKRTKESRIKATNTRSKSAKELGYYHTPESIKKTADAKRNKPRSVETKQKLSDANRGIPKSKEFANRVSDTMKGRIQITAKCIHCGIEMQVSNLARYHNDNCKLKIVLPQLP